MKKNIDIINKVFLGICLTNWILFFTFIWDIESYWIGALWFLLSTGLTFPYVATTKKAIKVMTEDEPDNVIFSDEEIMDMLQKAKVDLDPEAFGEATGHLEFRNWRSPDWQECYEIAEKDELDREVDKIVKEVSESRYEIGKGDYDAPRV